MKKVALFEALRKPWIQGIAGELTRIYKESGTTEAIASLEIRYRSFEWEEDAVQIIDTDLELELVQQLGKAAKNLYLLHRLVYAKESEEAKKREESRNNRLITASVQPTKKGLYVSKTCLNCKQEFTFPDRGEVVTAQRKYCGVKCRDMAGRLKKAAATLRSEKVVKTCLNCDTEFSFPSRNEWHDDLRKFCSKQCQVEDQRKRRNSSERRENPLTITKPCLECQNLFSFQSVSEYLDDRRKYCDKRCRESHRRKSIRKPETEDEFEPFDFEDDRLKQIAQVMLDKKMPPIVAKNYLLAVEEMAERTYRALGRASSDRYMEEQLKHWLLTTGREVEKIKAKTSQPFRPRSNGRSEHFRLAVGGAIDSILHPFCPPLEASEIQGRVAKINGRAWYQSILRYLKIGCDTGRFKRLPHPKNSRKGVYCHAAFYEIPLVGDLIKDLIGGRRGGEGVVTGYIKHLQTGQMCPVVKFDDGQTRMVNPEYCLIIHRPGRLEEGNPIKEQHELQAG